MVENQTIKVSEKIEKKPAKFQPRQDRDLTHSKTSDSKLTQ